MRKSAQSNSPTNKKRRPPGVRPTAEEKAEYVDLIYRYFVAGLSAIEIADKLGISTASVYRWQRERDAIQHSLNVSSHPNCIQIDASLVKLCSLSPHDGPATRDALFQFLTWIRWPADPEFHLAAMINCSASYLHKTHSSRNLEHLETEESSLLFRYLTLDVIARFSSPLAAFNPDFEIVSNQAARYDDRQFFAEILNYLLAERIIVSNKMHKTSLKNLQILVEAGAFGRDWAMSTRTFEKYWRKRAPSFPFLYVEQYHSEFDWSLNPQDADFARSVDEILATKSMSVYLGKVKWVIERLRSVLDARAARLIAFPGIPTKIAAIPVENPSLGRQLQAKISELF